MLIKSVLICKVNMKEVDETEESQRDYLRSIFAVQKQENVLKAQILSIHVDFLIICLAVFSSSHIDPSYEFCNTRFLD